MSIEQKQQLLLDEILNKGYDPDHFQHYIDKSGEIQLEEWKYEDLMEAIQKYQALQNDYFQILKCPQTQRHSQQKILVIGFEKVVKGIFQTQCIYYQIQVGDQIIKRTYDEFQTLRNSLSKHYSVPEFPNNKKSIMNEFTYIKQMSYLQSFVNFICDDQELYNLELVQEFLKTQNEIKQQIVPYSTLSGDYGVRINKDIDHYIRTQDIKLSQTQPLQKKAYKLIRQLMKQINQVSQTMQGVSDIYKKLYKEDTTHIILSHLFDKWSKIQQDQCKIINETLYNAQRFQFYLLNPLKDQIKARDNEFQKFKDFESKLKYKKEKLFQQQDVLRWDLDESFLDRFKLEQIKTNYSIASLAMCKNETQQLQEIKNHFAFFNLKCYESISQIVKHSTKTLSEASYKMSKMMALSLQQYHTLWADTVNNLQITK